MGTKKRSKILIVDDNEINTLLLRNLLEDEYDVISADNGRAGIELAIGELPDLILLDISMPGMDGYTVCARLKTNAQTKDIPVIFVTAMDELEDEARGLELGAIDYITKPFSPQIVKVRVHNHLELKLARDRLMQLSMMDGLTSIPNRRQFDRLIHREWHRCIRRKESLSLLILDIDFFKQYNDIYGHLQGDDCLKKVAAMLSGQMKRTCDSVARYGGEEFVCLLPDTGLDGAIHVANSIIRRMQEMNVRHEGSSIADFVTLSIGIVSRVPQQETSMLDFIAEADQALYQAKQQGRNRYIVSQTSKS